MDPIEPSPIEQRKFSDLHVSELTVGDFQSLIDWARRAGVRNLCIMGCSVELWPFTPAAPPHSATERPSNIPADVQADMAHHLEQLSEEQRQQLRLRAFYWSS